MGSQKTPYEVLGLEFKAPESAIVKKCNELKRAKHPDKNFGKNIKIVGKNVSTNTYYL